ncbi:unnamed protein product [Dicrocoelium dendriticum]|nr:unnamed protein product [Dicrocoelium dendriticum]
MDLRPALEAIVSGMPGSSWTSEMHLVGSTFVTDYWLRVQSYAIKRDEEQPCEGQRIIGKLQILRHNQRVVIAGIPLELKSSSERLFIETLYADSAGHWKILWTDTLCPATLYCSHSTYHTNKMAQHTVRADPIQVGPDVRTIGWVSGQYHQFPVKQGVGCRSITYSWCFVVPLPVDSVSQATVLLLPPQSECEHVSPRRCCNHTSSRLDHAVQRQGRHQFSTRVNPRGSMNEASRYTFGTSGSKQTEPVLNTTNASCMSALSPLLEPSSRLIILLEENRTQLSGQQLIKPIFFRAKSEQDFSFTSRFVTATPMVDNAMTPTSLPTSNNINCYTYIQTNDGLPAYTIGASISPNRTSVDKAPRLSLPHPANSCLESSSREKVRTVVPTQHGAFRDHSQPAELDSYSFERLRSSQHQKVNTYLVESHYQSQWSELTELSAEIVHFCSASLYEEGCASSLKIEGESNCLFNLQLLYDLRDLLIMSPLVRNRCQASYRGELEQQEANSVLTRNFALIEKNIVDHLQKLGNVVTLEFTSKMEIDTAAAAAGNRDKKILCTLTKRIANQLSSARNRRVFFTEFDHSNVGSSKPSGYRLQREDQHPNYPSIDVATVLAARFAVEACYLEQYLLDPWLPVRQWDSYLPVKWNVNVLTHWQSEELENWRQNARFLKNKYAILSPLAEYLRHTAPDSLRTGTQHSNDPKNLTNLLDALHQQALERAIQLEFFQLLCGLPHGLIALTEHMKRVGVGYVAALYIILRSLLEILCDVTTAASQLEFSWTFGLLQPLEMLIVQLLLLQECDTHTPRSVFFQPLYFYQNELITLMQLTGGVFSDHHLEQLLSKSSFTSILKQTCIRGNGPNQLNTEYNSELERPFVQEQLLMLLCWMDTLYQGRKIVDELLQQPESGRWSMAKLEVNLLRMEALEKHLRQQWAALQIESLVDDKETVFPKGILELAKQILHSRIHYHHYRVLSRTRRHCRLNKLIIQNHIELRHLMNSVRGGLDTRVSKDKKLVLKNPTAYSLTVKMLEEADLAKLSKQFALLEQRCNEATELASDTLFHFPLDLTEFGPDKYMLQPQNERAASLLTRLHTMGYLLLDRKRIRSQLNHASKQHEKFRDLVRSLTDFMIGLRTTVHQLHSALPHLIGRHLEDLAVAVDQFETTVSRDPEAHSQPSLTQYIKMAGQRLMELETCMEHASEIARFLLLLERGTALWPTYHRDRTLPVWQRRAEIEKEYENSFIGGQLNCAWGRLATMGDRLGRIQAGLPVRTASGEHLGFTNIAEDELNSLQNDSICSRSRTNLPNPLESPIDSSPVDAAKVREKRLNLRDLLGEHACVYPECKLASENWVPLSCEGSKYNRINEKARQLFMELVHFYASLRKKLIEQRQFISLHHPMDSIQHENTLESMTRSNWLQDKHLVQKYYELLRRVGEFRTCELPQVKRLMQKAESLSLLWYGQYSAPSDERGRDQSTDTSKYFQPFINESLEENGIAESQPCLFNQVRSVTRHTTELLDDVNNPAPIDYTVATTATLTNAVNILSSGIERLRADRTQNPQEAIRSSDVFAAPTRSELDNAIMGINDLKIYDLSSINKNGVVCVNEAPRRTIIDLERRDSRKRSLKRSREFDENASGGGVWSRSNMAYDLLCHSDENAKSGPGLKFENHPSQVYFSSSRFSEQNNTRSGCGIDEDLISVSKNDLAYSQPSMVNTNKSKADSIHISNRKLKKVRRRIKLSTVKQDEQCIADGTSSMIDNECAVCCERFISERNKESEAVCMQHSESVMGENNLRKWDKQSSTHSSASQSDVEGKSLLPWYCEIEGNRNDDKMRRSIGDKSSRHDSQLTHKATSKGTNLTESTTRQKRIKKKDIGKEQGEHKVSQTEEKEMSKEGGNQRKREANHGGNSIQDYKIKEEETAIENGPKLNMQKRKNHRREERKTKQAEQKVRKNKKEVELRKRMETVNKEKSIAMAEQGGKQTQSKKGKHYKNNKKLNTQAATEDNLTGKKEESKKKNSGEDGNTANEKTLQINQQAENYSRTIDTSKTEVRLENSWLPIELVSGKVAVKGAASSSVLGSGRLYIGEMRQRDKECVLPLGRSSVGFALEDHVGIERVVGEVAGGALTDSTIPTVNPEAGVSVDDGRVSGYVADPVLSECVRSNLLVVNRPASSPTSSGARVTASGSLADDARVAEKVDGGRFTPGLQSGELLCMSATEAVNVDAGVVGFVKESGGSDHPRMDSDVPSTAAVDISVNPDEMCFSQSLGAGMSEVRLESSSLPIELVSGQVAVEGEVSSSVVGSGRLYIGEMRQRDKECVLPLGRSSVGFALEDHVGIERVVGEVAGGALTDSTIPTVNPEAGVSVDDGRVSGYVADPVLSECVRSNLLVVNRPASSPTSSGARVTASGSLADDARVAEKVDGGRFTPGLQSGELLCMSATEAVNVDAGVVGFVKESGGSDHPRMDSDVPSTAAVDISVNPDEMCFSQSLGAGMSEVRLESSSLPIELVSGQVAVKGAASSSVLGSGRLYIGEMRQRDKECVLPLGRSSVGFALEDHVGIERVVGEVAGGALTDSTISTVNPEAGVSVDDGRVSGYVADPVLLGCVRSNLLVVNRPASSPTSSGARVTASGSLADDARVAEKVDGGRFTPGLQSGELLCMSATEAVNVDAGVVGFVKESGGSDHPRMDSDVPSTAAVDISVNPDEMCFSQSLGAGMSEVRLESSSLPIELVSGQVAVEGAASSSVLGSGRLYIGEMRQRDKECVLPLGRSSVGFALEDHVGIERVVGEFAGGALTDSTIPTVNPEAGVSVDDGRVSGYVADPVLSECVRSNLSMSNAAAFAPTFSFVSVPFVLSTDSVSLNSFPCARLADASISPGLHFSTFSLGDLPRRFYLKRKYLDCFGIPISPGFCRGASFEGVCRNSFLFSPELLPDFCDSFCYLGPPPKIPRSCDNLFTYVGDNNVSQKLNFGRQMPFFFLDGTVPLSGITQWTMFPDAPPLPSDTPVCSEDADDTWATISEDLGASEETFFGERTVTKASSYSIESRLDEESILPLQGDGSKHFCRCLPPSSLCPLLLFLLLLALLTFCILHPPTCSDPTFSLFRIRCKEQNIIWSFFTHPMRVLRFGRPPF